MTDPIDAAPGLASRHRLDFPGFRDIGLSLVRLHPDGFRTFYQRLDVRRLLSLRATVVEDHIATHP